MEDYHRLERLLHRYRQLHLMLFPIRFDTMTNVAALMVSAGGGGYSPDAILDSLQNEDDGLLINGLTNVTLVRTAGVESASTPNSLLTYTAPSAKYVMNSTGTLVSASTIRTDHDASNNPLGILVEPAATNLILQSESFGTSWVNTNSTEASGVTAPDGSSNGWTLTGSGGSVVKNTGLGFTATSGETYTCSIYLKAGTLNYAYINLWDSTEDFTTLVIDLSDGTAGDTDVGTSSGTIVRSNIIPAGNGWYRCIMAATITGTDWVFTIGTTTAKTGNTFNASGTIVHANNGTILMWGAQVEAGSVATSYIPTTTGTVTRAADQITLATSAFPWSATNGEIAVKARPTIANALGAAVSINDGSGNEEIVLYRDASGNLVYQVEDGGVDQLAPLDSGANAANATVFTIAAAYKANDFAISAGGAAATTDTGGTLPTVTTLEVGNNQADNYFNGHIQWIKYVPRDVSDANLVADSAL
jgi:hypothetical protein